MPTKIYTSENLQDSDVKSKALAYGKLLRSLAGRARMAAELARGMSIVSGEPPAIPRNPSGDYGVNMSGPPWGSAWRTTMGGMGGRKPDANFLGQKLVGQVDDTHPLIIPIHHYQQPFEVFNLAPFSRWQPLFRAYTASGGPIDVVATCEMDSDDTTSRSATLSIASTTEASYSDNALYWDVKPGRNRLRLKITSASTTAVLFCGLDFAISAKRSY